MKLGVMTVLFGDRSLEETLAYLAQSGVQAAEIGSGGFPGKAHCDPEVLLSDKGKLEAFLSAFERHNITLAAFATHGNAVHPQRAIAAQFHNDFENTVRLAEKCGVDTVVTFSGCPGDAPGAQHPNWVTCPWPDDFLHILDYQWNEVLLPYWQKEAAFAKDHGVNKIAFEMHPGFCVYNAETLLRLRAAVGNVIGANLDPSHLYWQGADIPAVIRKLGGAIYHFHAKDTKIDPINTAVNGVLDTKHYSDEINRSFIFRSVGYGHGVEEWKNIMSNLRLVGYDGVISIEHEDSLMTNEEGLQKAIAVLKEAMMFEARGGMFWA